VRAVAALALLGISGALYAVTTVDEFRLDPQRVSIDGAVHTSDEAARTALGLTGGARPNLFRLRTDELADSLRRLPAVVDAGVTVTLPDRLDVVLTERSPIMVWEVAGVRLLVDIDGVMFARAPGAELPAGLPLIVDRRARPAPPADGERLDRVDLAAVRQLAAVTPEMLGSRAARLRVSVDDVEGFTLDAEPERWHAVFGFYTAQLRSPDIIPGTGPVPDGVAGVGRGCDPDGDPRAGGRALWHVPRTADAVRRAVASPVPVAPTQCLAGGSVVAGRVTNGIARRRAVRVTVASRGA
jgi:hypothetical protein